MKTYMMRGRALLLGGSPLGTNLAATHYEQSMADPEGVEGFGGEKEK